MNMCVCVRERGGREKEREGVCVWGGEEREIHGEREGESIGGDSANYGCTW